MARKQQYFKVQPNCSFHISFWHALCQSIPHKFVQASRCLELQIITVRNIDTITIHFVWNLFIIIGLSSAEIIVINEIAIDTYPAQEDGTENAACIAGQPEPRSESGNPRLINIKQITAISNEYIFFSSHFTFSIRLYLFFPVYKQKKITYICYIKNCK